MSSHRFKVEEEEINPAWLLKQILKCGAPKKKSESVLCSGKCSARPY
jgi:hypothetical protein